MTTPRYNVKMPRHHEHNEDIYINSVIVTDYKEIVLRKLSGDAIFNTKVVPQCVARGHDDDTNTSTIIVSHYKERRLGLLRWNRSNVTKVAPHYVGCGHDDTALRFYDDTTPRYRRR